MLDSRKSKTYGKDKNKTTEIQGANHGFPKPEIPDWKVRTQACLRSFQFQARLNVWKVCTLRECHLFHAPKGWGSEVDALLEGLKTPNN